MQQAFKKCLTSCMVLRRCQQITPADLASVQASSVQRSGFPGHTGIRIVLSHT